MSKYTQSWIADFFGKTSEPTKPETLTEDDFETVDVSVEHDDTRPQDSKAGQSYEKNSSEIGLKNQHDTCSDTMKIKILGLLALYSF